MSEPKRNMYGCTPCPECGWEYRWGTFRYSPEVRILCDDCGFSEAATYDERDHGVFDAADREEGTA